MTEPMSYADIQFATIAVAVACAEAGRPDLVETAINIVWARGRTDAVAFVAAQLNGVEAPAAAAPATPAATARLPVDDKLAEVARRRFAAQSTGKLD